MSCRVTPYRPMGGGYTKIYEVDLTYQYIGTGNYSTTIYGTPEGGLTAFMDVLRRYPGEIMTCEIVRAGTTTRFNQTPANMGIVVTDSLIDWYDWVMDNTDSWPSGSEISYPMATPNDSLYFAVKYQYYGSYPDRIYHSLNQEVTLTAYLLKKEV